MNEFQTQYNKHLKEIEDLCSALLGAGYHDESGVEETAQLLGEVKALVTHVLNHLANTKRYNVSLYRGEGFITPGTQQSETGSWMLAAEVQILIDQINELPVEPKMTKEEALDLLKKSFPDKYDELLEAIQ
ncbi:hypothetical protein SmaMPs15_000084 [Stenotrophomonas maltophilia phage vB_SmaM_Ps15]|uniref:Uncharacterized protein n=1 Tax=Stenotrophomonas maltophilia phage vB_SmaM_Ps15 TaxID=3071007 RepID=A0AAE9JV00_9CAUD|nr:hypothetical protein PQC01_gp084 [Stenotrophomonas maltophilia phage vB_SmaM_Ps15]UMO77235.1 hypothetical protein SmaMPs15_000084 [Stenotrophomonas maltophilia phage vB_SmaM_Ps15]